MGGFDRTSPNVQSAAEPEKDFLLRLQKMNGAGVAGDHYMVVVGAFGALPYFSRSPIGSRGWPEKRPE